MKVHMSWRETAGLMALLACPMVCAQAPPAFQFTDTNGHLHASSEWAGKHAIVLFFVSTDCPLSNNYVPELNRIRQAYEPRGVTFYGVQGDATVADDEVKKHVRDFGYTFPYLFDPQESLASWTGATTTPEAAVFSPRGEVLYLGRIDNRLEDFGKQRTRITEFDLRDALDAILNGKPVPHPRTHALGCSITRRK
jgi:peroxiredoxin